VVISPTCFGLQRTSSGRTYIKRNIFILKNIIVDMHRRNKAKVTHPGFKTQSE